MTYYLIASIYSIFIYLPTTIISGAA